MFTSLHLGRRMLRGALVMGAAAATLGVVAGPAGAATYASAPVQYQNSNCGHAISGAPAIGAAYFHRQGTTDTVDFQLQQGQPGTTYFIELWDSATCSYIGTLADLTTSAWGSGEAVGSVSTTASKVFATAFDGVSTYNDTLTVSL
jgi:hypothetical protein